MNFPYPKRLTIRLLVSFLLVALPSVVIMGYVTFRSVRARLLTSVKEQLHQNIDLRQGELSRWMKDQINDAVFLSSLPGFQANAELLLHEAPGSPAARAAREQMVLRTRYFQSGEADCEEIVVLDKEGGRVVFSTREEHEGDFRVNDEYFLRGLKGTFFRSVYLSPLTLEPIMTISAPLFDQKKGLIGVLAVHLNINTLQEIVLSGGKMGKTAETFLVNGLNVVVAPSWGNTPLSVHSEGIDAVVKGMRGDGLYLNPRGVPVVGVYHWMEDLELGMVAEIALAEALAPAGRLGMVIAATGTVIFLGMALGVFMLARRIAAPIVRIRDAALQVSKGHLDVQVEAPVGGEVGELGSSFNHMTRELGRLYRAIGQSENYFRTIFQTSPDPITVVRLSDGVLLDVNQRVVEMFGYGREELLRSPTPALKLWENPVENVRFLVQLQKEGFVSGFESGFRRADGTVVVCRVSSRSLELDGQTVILSIYSDVTTLRRTEERLKAAVLEKELLLKEVHHRVKNNLQVISGLLNLQRAHIKDAETKAVYKESQNRIITMALIHESLYRSNDLSHVDLGLYLRNLADNLFNSYGAPRQRVGLEFSVESAKLVIDTAIPCGLIANELISNAIRHAFPGGRGGTVMINLRRHGPEFELTVRDNGAGLPADLDVERIPTLGLKLVTLLTEQLGGTLRIEREGGTTFRITFREYHEAGTALY